MTTDRDQIIADYLARVALDRHALDHHEREYIAMARRYGWEADRIAGAIGLDAKRVHEILADDD